MSEAVRLEWTGDAVVAAIIFARRRALLNTARFLLAMANRTVPLEEGTLERTGDADVNEEGTEAAVSYGTKYARRQHEELTWRHAAGRRAKWLELTFIEQAVPVRGLFFAEMEKALHG